MSFLSKLLGLGDKQGTAYLGQGENSPAGYTKDELVFSVHNRHKAMIGTTGYSDIDLFQESYFGQTIAYGFYEKGQAVGSSVSSLARMTFSGGLLSKAKEPWLGKSKPTAVGSVTWKDTQLTFASVHGLNRTSTLDATVQLDDVIQYMHEQVPVTSDKQLHIVAGDFNTHNQERVDELLRVMKKNNFHLIYNCPYKGFLKDKILDWVFISSFGRRAIPGFEVTKTSHEKTDFSDHNLIRFSLKLETK